MSLGIIFCCIAQHAFTPKLVVQYYNKRDGQVCAPAAFTAHGAKYPGQVVPEIGWCREIEHGRKYRIAHLGAMRPRHNHCVPSCHHTRSGNAGLSLRATRQHNQGINKRLVSRRMPYRMPVFQKSCTTLLYYNSSCMPASSYTEASS